MIDIINFKDKKMRYLKFGSGSKTIIMIPGLSIKSVIDSSDVIIDEYKIFDSNYTIYLFERIDIPKIYNITNMAEDILDSIKYLNLKKLYLLGASQGGMISVVLYLLDKKNIEKIVMASSSFEVPDYTERLINKWIDLAMEKKRKELVFEFAKYVYPKKFVNDNEKFFNSYIDSITDQELDLFIPKAISLIGFDVRHEIDEIDVPILIVNDKKDNLIRYSDIIENTMVKPNFIYHYYENTGHALYDLEPNFKPLVLDFLSK